MKQKDISKNKSPKVWSLILLSIVVIIVFIAIYFALHHQVPQPIINYTSTTVKSNILNFSEFALEFTNKSNELYGLPANNYISFPPSPLPYSEPDVSVTEAYSLVYGFNNYAYINISEFQTSFYYFEPGSKLAVLNTSLPLFVSAKIEKFDNMSMLQYEYTYFCRNLTSYWFFNVTPANKTDYQLSQQLILMNNTYFNSTAQTCEIKAINRYYNGTANKLIQNVYIGKYKNYLVVFNAYGNINTFNANYSNEIFDHLYRLFIQNYNFINN
ncbi:MAG: hypothetical protein ACP5RF_03285 [Candidatus Micrarchaeia archaeon]